MAQEKDLYFEDFTVGRCFESAGMTLTESQILRFRPMLGTRSRFISMCLLQKRDRTAA